MPRTKPRCRTHSRRLTRGRTVITIAHRLKTILDSDQILVLDDGRLLEQGTHLDLLARNGIYARLVDATDGRSALEPADGVQAPAPRDVAPSPLGFLEALSSQPAGWAAIALQPEATSSSDASILNRLLGFLQGQWNRVGLSVLLGSLTIGSSLGLMGAAAWLISTAALRPSIATLGIAIVGVRLFGIARAVFRYLERLSSHDVTFRLLRNIRVWWYQTLEPLAPACLMDVAAGDLLARITADVETLENIFGRLIAPPLTAAFVGAGSVAFFVLAGLPQIGLLVAISFVATGLLLPTLTYLLSRRAGRELVQSRAAMHSKLVDDVQGLAEIVAFGRSRDRLKAVGGLSDRNAQAQRELARVAALQAGLSSFLPHVALWVALVLAIQRVATGNLIGVMLAPVALVTLAAFEAVAPLPAAAQLWPATREAAGRLLEIADTPPAVREISSSNPADSEAGGAAPARHSAGKPDLEFRNLTFEYPGANRPAVDHVSFHLEAGRKLGIVGLSGAGKSSLAYLALRFWDYTSGEICLNGTSLKQWPADQVRARIGYVSAQDHFFDTSIYENLRLARRGVTRPEIEQAAQEAQIHEHLCTLPHGYDTLIGEHGLRLSAGERQRLSIARLLIKDAPLWILDEPTAHLDPVTEGRLLANLFRLMRHKTVLMITHRLVGLDNLDEILVMERGMVVQRGSHRDLVARPGPVPQPMVHPERPAGVRLLTGCGRASKVL